MRRPVGAKGIRDPWLVEWNEEPGADQREAEVLVFALTPFPLSQGGFRNGPERSRARGLCAA
jgi:hypothetical protein